MENIKNFLEFEMLHIDTYVISVFTIFRIVMIIVIATIFL